MPTDLGLFRLVHGKVEESISRSVKNSSFLKRNSTHLKILVRLFLSDKLGRQLGTEFGTEFRCVSHTLHDRIDSTARLLHFLFFPHVFIFCNVVFQKVNRHTMTENLAQYLLGSFPCMIYLGHQLAGFIMVICIIVFLMVSLSMNIQKNCHVILYGLLLCKFVCRLNL